MLCDKHGGVSILETVFYSSNFFHLTGVVLSKDYKKRVLNKTVSNKGIATLFFNDCVDNKLKLSDFDFDKGGQSVLKLSVIMMATAKNLTTKMYGEYNGFILYNLLYTERIIGNNNLCLGFVKKEDSNI